MEDNIDEIYGKICKNKCAECGGNIWIYGDDVVIQDRMTKDHDQCRIFFSKGKAFCCERCVDDYTSKIRWSRRER